MSKATAVVSFSAASSVSFSLEQKAFEEKNPAEFADWYDEQGLSYSGAGLFTAWAQYLSGCDEDGALGVSLLVRLSDINLDYRLRASWGEWGNVYLRQKTRTEYLTFELETASSVDFGEILSWSWNGEVLDENGDILNNPEVTVQTTTATTGQKVLGVLECQVYEEYYEHELTITPREPTAEQLASEESILEELYASTCWLICSDEIKMVAVEMPDNFYLCDGGYGGVSVHVDDGGDDATMWTVQIGEIFNYCSGDSIAGATVYIDGAAVSGTSVQLASGTHSVRVVAEGYTPTDEDDLSENDTFTLP